MSEQIKKVFGYLRGWLLKRRVSTTGHICSYGPTTIHKCRGDISIGNRTSLWPEVMLAAESQVPGTRAKLTIGQCSSIGDRTQIHCGQEVTIGDYVLLSWDVTILEFDHHTFGNGPPDPRPIIIEDEVWIGCHVIILKGVTIGKGATIGAGSVVTKNIPPYTFAAGNPAKPIKTVESWRGSRAVQPAIEG